MQKCIILFLLSSIFSTSVFCQNDIRWTSSHAPNIFIEAGGNGGLASVNFDMRFSQNYNGLGARIGVGAAYVSDAHVFFRGTTTFPIAINYLFGSGPHFLEVGAGLTIGQDPFPFAGNKSYFVPNLGYRFQAVKKGLLFRGVVSPFIGTKVRFGAGVSLGLVF
jgi:hypothetical protein